MVIKIKLVLLVLDAHDVVECTARLVHADSHVAVVERARWVVLCNPQLDNILLAIIVVSGGDARNARLVDPLISKVLVLLAGGAFDLFQQLQCRQPVGQLTRNSRYHDAVDQFLHLVLANETRQHVYDDGRFEFHEFVIRQIFQNLVVGGWVQCQFVYIFLTQLLRVLVIKKLPVVCAAQLPKVLPTDVSAQPCGHPMIYAVLAVNVHPKPLICQAL